MSRPRPRQCRLAAGMSTAEYAVCVACALGIVSLLASEPFREFLLDLLSAIWRAALQPRHLLHLTEVTTLDAEVPHARQHLRGAGT